MTANPPGWHPDPWPAPPGALRWWDGGTWTAHVHPPMGAQPPLRSSQATHTPDGVRLAGWGVRLGAYVIDVVLTAFLSAIVGGYLLVQVVRGYVDWFHQITDSPPDSAVPMGEFYGHVLLPLILFQVLALVVVACYNVIFLRYRGATPGKMLCGLEVRPWQSPGRLAWKSVWLRWLVKFGAGSVVPGFSWVDGLWPLWHQNRQALHDVAAHTCVVHKT